MSEVLTVRKSGRVYEIPAIWVIGFQTGARARGEDARLQAAVEYWIWQADMEDDES